jgi:hypothetical protein
MTDDDVEEREARGKILKYQWSIIIIIIIFYRIKYVLSVVLCCGAFQSNLYCVNSYFHQNGWIFLKA